MMTFSSSCLLYVLAARIRLLFTFNLSYWLQQLDAPNSPHSDAIPQWLRDKVAVLLNSNDYGVAKANGFIRVRMRILYCRLF